MARLVRSVPIGVKIFGIAISMLMLLLIVAYIGYNRTSNVHGELVDIAKYLTPITAYVSGINVHALEQEIHIERIFRFYEIEPINRQSPPLNHRFRRGLLK